MTNATFASHVPGGPDCFGASIDVDGQLPEALAQRMCIVMTTPDLFPTMRIPLRAGRLLVRSDDDRHDVLQVLIDETAARTLWAGRTAIGGLRRFAGPNDDRFEIIGVVGDFATTA